jgi:hypothetical protein
MNETPRSLLFSLLVLPSILFLIWYFPLPFPLKLFGFIAVPLWINGLRHGGKILLVGSPLFLCWISLAYFSVSPRIVGAFVIAYMLGLFVVGVVGYGKLTRSVWRFFMETRAKLRGSNSRAVLAEPVLGPKSSTQKQPWAERLARRILRVS